MAAPWQPHGPRSESGHGTSLDDLPEAAIALSIPQDQHMETPLAAPVATFWSFQDLIYTSSDVDSENAAPDCGICLYSV